MFENCTIKYHKNEISNQNECIHITYPPNESGISRTIVAPIHEENRDYQNILKWVAEGNTIEEAD